MYRAVNMSVFCRFDRVIARLQISFIRLIACLTVFSFSFFTPNFCGCSKAPEPDLSAVIEEETPAEETVPEEDSAQEEQVKVEEQPPPPPPAEGTVAAIRANAKERDSRQKKRIDSHITKRYVGTEETSYDVVTLTDGSTVMAMDVTEQDDTYTMKATLNAERTAFATETLKKSEVASIEPESGDEAMWLKVKGVRPPATASDGYYHDRMIALVFDYFLDQYPESEHTSKVRDIREMWVDEKTKLDDMRMKVKGEWYGPDEVPPKIFPRSTRQALAFAQTNLNKGRYFEAAKLCSQIRIPDGFDSHQEAFKVLCDRVHEGFKEYLRKEKAHIDGQRQDASEKYDRELAKINSMRAHRARTLRNTRAESEWQQKYRISVLEKKAQANRKKRQSTARQKALAKYNTAIGKADQKYARVKAKVNQAVTDMRKASL